MKLSDAQELELEKQESTCENCGATMVMAWRQGQTRKLYQLQCAVCGSWKNKEYRHTEERMARAIPWDEELQAAIDKKREEKRQAYILKQGEWQREYQAYQDYLSTPQWRMIRMKRLTMDKMRCTICGNPAKVVHHITYDRLYHENLDDLTSLCWECHSEIHADKYGESR